MKQRFLLICAVIVVTIPILTAVMPAHVSAISAADTTAAEDAAERSATSWCSGNNVLEGLEAKCKEIYKQGYLGDGFYGPRSDPAAQSCTPGGKPGDGCPGAYRAGEKGRGDDWPEVSFELCTTYIEAAQKSKKSPEELQKVKDGDLDNATNACVKGFRIGVGQVRSSCSGSGYEKVACNQGKELADFHIFSNYEAAAHAEGKSAAEAKTAHDEASAAGDASTDAGTDGPSCDDPGSGVGDFVGDAFSLSWVICPTIDGLVTLTAKLDGTIKSLLSVGSPKDSSDPNQIFCNSDTASANPDDDQAVAKCRAYHTAWESFRNIALGLLAIVLLIVVISQAIGAEFVDAYTIRKLLPRLLTAAIAITLSWSLMQFFVQLTNDIGYGVSYLISAPFAAANLNQLTIGSDGSGVIAIIGGVGLLSFGIFGLLSFALTAALAVLIAFLVMILRQIIIIVFIIIAPIAIVMYILPNTQFAYKLWWDNFNKALLMFPLIAAMIAIGHVFSGVADSSNVIGQLMGFMAYFAPYFLIPLTFGFAGNIMGGLGNFINQRGSALGEPLKNFRTAKRQENFRGAKNFSRFSDKRAIGRAGNTALGALTNPGAAIRGRKGIRANRLTSRLTEGAAALEHDETYQAHKGDDNFLLAVANRGMAKEKLEGAEKNFNKASRARQAALAAGNAPEAAKQADNMRAAETEMAARSNALALASQVSSRDSAGSRITALNDLAGTGFQFSPGDKGYQELSDSVDSIVGTNDPNARASLMNTAQYRLRGAGRPDLGGINHGNKNDTKMGIRKLGNYQRGSGKTDLYHGGAQAWLGKGSVGANGKTKDGAELQKGILDSIRSGDTGFSDVAEWHSMLIRDKSSASDANKLEIQKQIDAIQGLAGNPEGIAPLKTSSMDEMAEAAGFKAAIEQNNREMRSDIPEAEREENKSK